MLFLIFALFPHHSDASPKIGFEQLMIRSEMNPSQVVLAKKEAARQKLPVNIMTAQRIHVEALDIENGRPVYAVVTNPLDMYDGAYTAFYEELIYRVDMSVAKIDYGNGRVTDNTGGMFEPVFSDNPSPANYLMIAESSNDRVYIFNPQNGDLIDTAFIPRTNPELATPKHALQHFNGYQILVSDQLTDVVQNFYVGGSYINVFAPAGGVNNNILDNIRGIAYKPNNHLLVTVGSGTNSNTIQEFDLNGNNTGTFIGTANLNSPFDILYRSNDILVSNSSGTNKITQFDYNGNFLSNFFTASTLAFPQQKIRLPNGLLAVCGFSLPSGLIIMDSLGNYIKTLNAVTGNRGVYLLGNGHYLTTAGTSVHEIDSANGTIIRTVFSGSNSFQYISLYQSANPVLALNINLEACNLKDTVTVRLRQSASPYNMVQAVTGTAGQATVSLFNFSAAVNGTPYYIEVLHRNSVKTWSGTPKSFVGNALNYNFTSSSSQAFGSNQTSVGGKWSIYTGDVNQDNVVDLTDSGIIENDIFNFASGYIVTDLNCDGVVDLTDAAYADNNAFNFISAITP
ncbi:MAG: hypothetical protein JSS91_00030 [Bacteroidetes bacterium]|nr:hypothetical protein [Bacteroidota bacterium]